LVGFLALISKALYIQDINQSPAKRTKQDISKLYKKTNQVLLVIPEKLPATIKGEKDLLTEQLLLVEKGSG